MIHAIGHRREIYDLRSPPGLVLHDGTQCGARRVSGMGRLQSLVTDGGEELIVLSRREYDALLARLGDEDAEDRAGARLLEESRAALARGEDVALSAAEWARIEGGESAVRVLREHRGFSFAALAARVGVGADLLAEIEAGSATLDAEGLDRLAAALNAPRDLLVGA